MKTGMIAYWPTAQPPNGWLLCDGADIDPKYTALIALVGTKTPNLANVFIRGAGATPLLGTGGADTATLGVTNLPAHSHGGNTGLEGSHTHTIGSGQMDANTSHNHGGSSTTELNNQNHTHTDLARNTGGSSAGHTHRILINEGVGEGSDGNYLDSNPTADPGQTFDGGSAQNKSQNHTHSIPAKNTGSNSADHNHTLTVGAVNLDHTHGFSLATPLVGHLHTMADSGSATPSSFSIVPVHTALHFVIKA